MHRANFRRSAGLSHLHGSYCALVRRGNSVRARNGKPAVIGAEESMISDGVTRVSVGLYRMAPWLPALTLFGIAAIWNRNCFGRYCSNIDRKKVLVS